VYGWGAEHPELFEGPDTGAAATVDAVAYVTGLEIDHFVLVDLTGFADVVDAFGGVKLEVTEPVDGPLYDVVTGGYEMVHIPAGTQRLDGDHALAFARARYGSSDYARMGRQRCILATMAAQADVLSLFSKLGKLLNAVEANLVTDISSDMIPDLIRLTPRVSSRDIRVIGFDATWGAGFTAAGSTIPDLDRIREAVKLTIRKPGKADLIGATTAAAGC
jgi:LCP family protein required for cell wall assembly